MEETAEQPRPSGVRTGNLVRKGFWAVLDQGLFSVANYMVVSLLMARWLSPRDYGAFVTAYSAFFVLGVIHIAVLTEPMLVLGPGRYRENLSKYLGTLLRGHLLISGLGSIALAICGVVCLIEQQTVLAWAFFWFALTGHLTLFLWLMRRACYARMNPKRAAIAGVGYLALMIAGLVLMHWIGAITIASALLIMGACSMIIGIGLAMTGDTLQVFGIGGSFLRDVLVEHWHYCKWGLPTAILVYLQGNVSYFLLPGMMTLEKSAALKAISNPFLPIGQANAALCLLLIPVFVRARGTPDGKWIHRLSLLVLTGCPMLYCLVLGIFNHAVTHLMYRGTYDAYSYLMWIMGVQQVISAFCGVYSSLLRAHQKLHAVFWASLVAAIAAIILGVIAARHQSMVGVCWSIVIAYALHHLTLWLFSREVHKSKDMVKPLAAEGEQPPNESHGEPLGKPAAIC